MANGVLTSPLFNNEQASARNSSPEDIETSEDYLYTLIHKKIREQVFGKMDVTEDFLKQLIDEALEEESEKSDD